jgi:hypothetical protein
MNEFVIKNGFFSQGNSSVTGDLSVSGTSRIQNKLSVGTPTESSAVMEVTSTSQGLLIPRMTSVQKLAITSPAVGLMVFDTDTSLIEMYDTFWGWMPISPTNEWYSTYGFNYFNDGINGDNILGVGASGSGAGVNGGANNLGSNKPGNATFITGTLSNGTARIATNSQYQLGGGKILNEYALGLITLSNSTDRYVSIIGFQDSYGTANQTDGIYFLYDEGGVSSGSAVSPNWQCVTSSNSVRTFTTTSVTANTAYKKFKIVINDNATEVLFYIDNVLVATHTTNIPSGSARLCSWGIMTTKTAGTNSVQTVVADYISFKQKFTTPR